ncbi:MAG: cadmium-translocating P-type ATPase [Pelosinus sp.]|nr:cadmium-translocating P-type ATPase [Pelosinus sp.]
MNDAEVPMFPDEVSETLVYTIEGLDCADCASKLESGIRRLHGILDVQVNFTAAKMKVVLNSKVINPEDVLKAIKGFGYSAVLAGAAGARRVTFRVSGLDCADCAAKLEKKILGTTGVKTAKLNFGAGKLEVEHCISDEEIIKVIVQAGYEAAIIGKASSAAQEKSWWQRPRILTTALSGLLLLAASIQDLSGQYNQIQVTVLYLGAMLAGGYHLAKSGLYSLRSFTFDMNFLMTIAALGAGTIGEWSEGGVVVFLFSLGNVLQVYTMDKARQSIRALMDLKPREALVRRNGQEIILKAEEIVVGDVLLVKPGERIAMDGIVANGVSTVNQATITGESMPVEKKTGDSVYAGTINEQGALEITVTKLDEDSTLAKIMHLVEEAQAQKAPSQQFVDKFSKVYTPCVIIGALLLMVVPWLLFNQPFTEWFYKALVMLVISCPCALVISTPVSIVSAIGNASRIGVLIKGGAYLEQIGTIEAVAFDKTGTLTIGKPKVTDIISVSSVTEEEILVLAASVEKKSEHPLADAIVQRAKDFALKPVSDFKALIGRGAQGTIGTERIYVGNLALFKDAGVNNAQLEAKVVQIEAQGKTVMLVGSGKEVYGLIAAADTLRENSSAAIKALRAVGIKHLAMLTGDNRRASKVIAEKIDIDTVLSELLPEGKVAALRDFGQKYGGVIMVGDGVNDAPALATADVGIAMGVAGSDTALETADIALMSDDLTKLSYTIKLSRKMMKIIRQNIAFSIILKGLFLLGTLIGFVNLWLAVFADTGAAILVTLNGMRLVQKLK